MNHTLVLDISSSMLIFKLEDYVGKKVKVTFKSRKSEKPRSLRGTIIETDLGLFLQDEGGNSHSVNHSELSNIQLL